MFTLGTKLRVLNSDATVKVYDSTLTTLRATSAAITASDVIVIEGFANIPIGSITALRCRRGSAATKESKDWTVAVPLGTAVGEAVEVKVTLTTTRQQSEFANDYIQRGRPIIFTTDALTGITAANIRTAIVTAWTNHSTAAAAMYPFDIANGVAATDFAINLKDGYESVSVKTVELRRTAPGTASTSPISLAVGVTNTVGGMGVGTGKFVSESVRLANGLTNDPYGIDTNESHTDLRALYTQITISWNANYDEKISHIAADHSSIVGSHTATLYLNESTTLAANGGINDLAAAAVLSAGLTPLTLTAIAAPLTTAQELTEALILASGASTTTAALFIA